ncbi:MAG TPA: RNA polymerase sigma factor [Puia sp.]|jgi:RNA polymerase sigma-70 factor (ECF subfamily)|nr:RNA polymerase sigma factor [Puia sp.]
MSIEVFKERILPMKDKLFRFAFRLLQNVQEAEDAIQDVMAGLWARREEWGQWRNMEAYCMTATRNNCLDRIRKRHNRREQDKEIRQAGSLAQDPYEKMMNKEMSYRIRQCMATLPENQQLVIQLREIEGFSYSEIAEVLNISLDQVKVNLFRGRHAIKKSIIKEEEDVWSKTK